ncbi:hypothetical protein C2S53_012102 [Perilla frutescens var. hirtella]|uniref:Uncharacterized protein n=1 Tax=Perilla frutescens var. hirtella TaxID=608512 RepID=A0AAD4PCQ1_PERFH|nr:hypothetical protein C2S53_012102 [Perilla frutescens var. hirtella]
MEGNCISVSPPPSVDICCATDLNRSNSDASTLTAEICEDFLHHSPGDSTMWTDEKHSLYLENLEVSFVKQLHQSINSLAQCSNQVKGDKIITQIHPITARDTSEQVELAAPLNGCRGKNSNCNRGDPLSHVSVDSLRHIKNPWVYHSKRVATECPTALACTPEPLTLCDTENYGKVVKSHGPDTCSHQFSASNQYSDSHDLVEEGTGQNFVDEDDETDSDTESRVKRLKTL